MPKGNHRKNKKFTLAELQKDDVPVYSSTSSSVSAASSPSGSSADESEDSARKEDLADLQAGEYSDSESSESEEEEEEEEEEEKKEKAVKGSPKKMAKESFQTEYSSGSSEEDEEEEEKKPEPAKESFQTEYNSESEEDEEGEEEKKSEPAEESPEGESSSSSSSSSSEEEVEAKPDPAKEAPQTVYSSGSEDEDEVKKPVTKKREKKKKETKPVPLSKIDSVKEQDEKIAEKKKKEEAVVAAEASSSSSMSDSSSSSSEKSPAKKGKKGEKSIPLSKISSVQEKDEKKKKKKSSSKNVGEEPDLYLRQSYAKLDLGHMDNKVLLRVYFADNSHKTLFIDPHTTTTTDVWRMLCERLQLPKEEWQFFFLWTVSADLELLMYSNSLIEESVKKYPELRSQFTYPMGYRAPGQSRFHGFFSTNTSLTASKYVVDKDTVTFQDLPQKTGGSARERDLSGLALSMSMASPRAFEGPNSPRSAATSTSVPVSPRTNLTRTRRQMLFSAITGTGTAPIDTIGAKFLFKTTQILPHAEELNITSPAGVYLLFIEGVHDVMCGNHPVTPSTAVKLAALQLYGTKGPFSWVSWKEGTVSKNLSDFIPEHLKSLHFADAWEKSVCEAYQALSDKMSKMESQIEYVNILKKIPSYGSTYFPVTYNPKETTLFKQLFQGDILLAVNAVGIHMIDSRLCKRKGSSPIRTFPFQRILSWDSDKLTFFFEYMPVNVATPKPALFVLSTPHGNMINDLIHDWLEAFTASAEKVKEEISKSRARAAATTTTTTTAQDKKSRSKKHGDDGHKSGHHAHSGHDHHHDHSSKKTAKK